MKKSEAVSILQAIAFKADGYEQFVEVHFLHNAIEVSVSAHQSRGEGLGYEEDLLIDVSSSTFVKAVAALVKQPEWKSALQRAESHHEENRKRLGVLADQLRRIASQEKS